MDNKKKKKLVPWHIFVASLLTESSSVVVRRNLRWSWLLAEMFRRHPSKKERGEERVVVKIISTYVPIFAYIWLDWMWSFWRVVAVASLVLPIRRQGQPTTVFQFSSVNVTSFLPFHFLHLFKRLSENRKLNNSIESFVLVQLYKPHTEFWNFALYSFSF